MAIEIALVLLLLIIVGLWALFTAQRLNSLHIRTDASLAQLQAALDRRAAVTAAVAPELAALAQRAESTELYQGHFEPRTMAERELSAAIVREFPADRRPAALADAEGRIQLAHRFYNEAVSDTRALRLRPAVRLFHLGGTAKLPEYFDYMLAE
ncbi:hypothetical protein [Corynebacterium marquesiae]|uniref:hypothetical protein n=1 Tax=Corynebacterium marquesiae TaxID=2913503 RepID=UPI00254B9507|nr:hypothetical protein [Corynebacterium marquesiae]MDK8479522.1 hypothetical protein [Corynebacterium marquesiae]